MTVEIENTANVDELAEGLRKLEVCAAGNSKKPDKGKTPDKDKKRNKDNKPVKDKNPELKPKKGLTPYQGDKRAFGHFRCEDCHNDWSSAYSWADTAQKCELCKKFRFPYGQIPFYAMYRGGGRGQRKPHIEPSCGKCIQIRDSCTTLKKCNERAASESGLIVGLAEGLQNVKPKPPKRKRSRKNKKNKMSVNLDKGEAELRNAG